MHTSVSIIFSEFFTSLHLQFSTLCTFFIYRATMAALNLAALRQQVNTDDSNESVVDSIVRRLTLPLFRANGQFDEVLNRINTFTAVVTTLPDLNNGQPNFHYQQSDAVKNAQRDLINKPVKTDDDVRMANELIRIKGAIYVEIIIPLLTRLLKRQEPTANKPLMMALHVSI
eukprot:434840_1